MTDWVHLTRELDAWAAAERTATIWWRDDDAVEPSPDLERLLTLAADFGVPIAIAVIPAHASAALAYRLEAVQPRPTPMQHGLAHANHAPPGGKKWELGSHRPLHQVTEDLARGRDRMTELFGADWTATIVPPWNRIAPEVVAALPGLGIRGLSTYGARKGAAAAPGVVQVNCHVDIMRWSAPRGFAGREVALGLLIDHLAARRSGAADEREPTGLLTHHLQHDEAAWSFLADLLPRLTAHPAVRFVSADAAFAAKGEPDAKDAA